MLCVHNDSFWLVPWSCDNVYRRFFHDCELLWFFEGRFFRIRAFASETWMRGVGQKWRSCQTSTNNNHIIEFRVCALSSSPCWCSYCSNRLLWLLPLFWLQMSVSLGNASSQLDNCIYLVNGRRRSIHPSIHPRQLQQQLNQHYRRPCHPKKEVLLEE